MECIRFVHEYKNCIDIHYKMHNKDKKKNNCPDVGLNPDKNVCHTNTDQLGHRDIFQYAEEIILYIENTRLVLNIAQVYPARLRKSKLTRLERILYDTVPHTQLSWSVAVTKLRRMNSKKVLHFFK